MSAYEFNHAMARAPGNGHIYGVRWSGDITSAGSVLSRTDEAANFTDPMPYVSGATEYSSPFDDIMPWKGIQRVTDSNAGTLVEIPKFWYNITTSGESVLIQIADFEAPDFVVSPAHMNRGDGKGERDVVYIGRYHCSSSNYKSESGVLPKVSITRDTARNAIHDLGSTIWQSDYAMRFTIWLLYLVEYANFDSQAVIGFGVGNNSSLQNTGASDTMPYHTGTPYSSRDTWGVGVQYRWIEGLWDNCYDFVDGIAGTNSMYIGLVPDLFNDSSTTGGASTIAFTSNVHGNVGGLAVSHKPFLMFYPLSGGNAYDTTFWSDQVFLGTSLAVGAPGFKVYNGPIRSGAGYGLFNIMEMGSSANVGCRLMKLP